MPRYKLTIAYDGTDFHGWQRQYVGPRETEGGGEGAVEDVEVGSTDRSEPRSVAREIDDGGVNAGRPELRTVQGIVESAVRYVVREPVCVFGASRTDTGVHAKGQVAAFTTGRERGRGWPPERGTEPLLRAINSRLPEDVLVLSCEEAEDDFNPIKAASKGYSYTWHVSPPPRRLVFGRQYVQHVKVPVDVDAMNAAAALIVGEHDFAGFTATGHGRLSTVRTVFSCAVRRAEGVEGGERLVLEVSGNGFLWNMVRIIGGTILEVGLGRRSLDHVRRALEMGHRRSAGVTLPPRGLCLEWIRYGGKLANEQIANGK